MLISRGVNILRTVRHLRSAKSAVPNVIPKRFDHHKLHYRESHEAPRIYKIGAEVWGGIAWWWILWHFYHEPGHVFGEWDVPNPENWTDEELGIPPDDVD